MFLQRFALAAVELNGPLYAVGGFDGKNYLRYFIVDLIYIMIIAFNLSFQ